MNLFWQAHLYVGPVNEAGLRGTLATRDIAEGATLVYIPTELIVQFGAPAHDKPPVSTRLIYQAFAGSALHPLEGNQCPTSQEA